MGFYKLDFVVLRKFDPFQNLKKKLAKLLLPLKATFKPLFCKILLSFLLSPGTYDKEQKISFFSVVSRISLENSRNCFLLYEKVWSINQCG